MKKVTIATLLIVVLLSLWNYFYYYDGRLFIPSVDNKSVCIASVDDKAIYVHDGDELSELTIKGVRVGMSKPGYFATEEGVSKEEFIEWFEQIDALGANVILIDRVGTAGFYAALYEYNSSNPTPLYLIQQIAFDDYFVNSPYSANDTKLRDAFLKNSQQTIDSVHGRRKAQTKGGLFPQYYRYDVSDWVIGYILGGEWESALVSYTNHTGGQQAQYDGRYLCTQGAGNFEIFLAEMGDSLISYEESKYGRQTPISFSNWTMTDPLIFAEDINMYFSKAEGIDVEHIIAKDSFIAGQFASYMVNTAYPDFCRYMDIHEENTYLQYLSMLVEHHNMPVVVNGFGFSTSRGMSAYDPLMERNAGGMTEQQQGEALIATYEDILQSGCVGGIINCWQDEWYKSTWNTVAMTDENSNAYWLDVQTCDQQYGLLAFDPGEYESVCYVDGVPDEWSDDDIVCRQDEWEMSLKYDEAYVYLMIRNPDYRLGDKTIYVPIDTTPKSGSRTSPDYDVSMTRNADFLIVIDGEEGSALHVQDRYDIINALYYKEVSSQNFFSKEYPSTDTDEFSPINMLRQEELFYEKTDLLNDSSAKSITIHEFNSYNPLHFRIRDSYETGKLRYGNANPNSEEYCSQADFCSSDGVIEIRLPWGLLNFEDPTKMLVHDDYYECLGVEPLAIDSIYVGIGDGTQEIGMQRVALNPLGKNPKYHERKKASYEILRKYWNK